MERCWLRHVRTFHLDFDDPIPGTRGGGGRVRAAPPADPCVPSDLTHACQVGFEAADKPMEDGWQTG